MRKVIIDTNFILSCVKQKIDFFEYFESEGYKILIPKQVIAELERITKSKKKKHFRENAFLALKMLEKNYFEKIDLKQNYVDAGIRKYLKENPKVFIASLDRNLTNDLEKIFVIKRKKRIEKL